MFETDQDGVVLRPTTAFVDLGAIQKNITSVRNRVGPSVRIMGIVKANAYGHGLLRTAQAMLDFGVDELGVAFLEEGIALRRAGVSAPILVLGGIIGNQIVHFLEHDLQLTASSTYKLEQIDEVAKTLGRRAKIHLKIDTGMERIGVHWYSAEALLLAATRARHCDVSGIFSHFASSDSEDETHTKRQLERFMEVLRFFERHSLPMPCRHIANSGGVLQHPDSFFDMVRPGLVLYGVSPSRHLEGRIPLWPALSLKTRVVYFKVVRAGSPLSYDSTWRPERDTRVVTLPVGYGDGYFRALSGKAQVLIHGTRYPVVGRITMDATMVDIGDGSAYNGDEVVLLGVQGSASIRVEELAEWAGTIPYEIFTAINTRVPRCYLNSTISGPAH